ncbi:MAG: helix-turn-helix transcriptional regulator [Taibaiella sp.]|nr:helix-turn-helix transcriptional regulator [Taibaiella sp.]
MAAERTKAEQTYLLKVGRKIRSVRESSGHSQETFAVKCGLDRTYISDVERGERNISLLNLRKIANALKVEVHFLVQ